MPTIIGNIYAEPIIDLMVSADSWGAMFIAMPTLINPLAAETAGGGYARPSAVMERQGRRLVNANTWIFPGVPAGTQVAVGLFNAATNGALFIAASFNPQIVTPGDKSVILLPGEVAFAL